jgi:hypothetical protein
MGIIVTFIALFIGRVAALFDPPVDPDAPARD